MCPTRLSCQCAEEARSGVGRQGGGKLGAHTGRRTPDAQPQLGTGAPGCLSKTRPGAARGWTPLPPQLAHSPQHPRASAGLTPRPPGCRAPTCTGVCGPEGRRPSPHGHPVSQSRRGMHWPQFYCQHPPFTYRVLCHLVLREKENGRGLCVPSLRRACLELGAPGSAVRMDTRCGWPQAVST